MSESGGVKIQRFLHHSLGGYFVDVKINPLPTDCVSYSDFDKLQSENQGLREEIERLRALLSKENLVEIVEEWLRIWMNQTINPDDTARYRRRAMGVDANMRYSLARIISEKALQSGGG